MGLASRTRCRGSISLRIDKPPVRTRIPTFRAESKFRNLYNVDELSVSFNTAFTR